MHTTKASTIYTLLLIYLNLNLPNELYTFKVHFDRFQKFIGVLLLTHFFASISLFFVLLQIQFNSDSLEFVHILMNFIKR